MAASRLARVLSRISSRHWRSALTFAGTLNVTLLNSFTPMPRQQFDLFDFASDSGTFTAVNLPTLPIGEQWDSSALYTTGVISVNAKLMGDANVDGTVNVGDLGSLATNYGVTSGATWQQGDFNGDGAVNVGDLGSLATNYGMSVGGGGASPAASAASSTAIPEPAAAFLVSGLGILNVFGRRRRRQR